MKEEDYKRQLIIANSLYEMGVDVDLIKQITTVSSNDLINFREKQEKCRKNIDNKKDDEI